VIENLLAGIVLVAYQKRGDFVLKLEFDRFEPRNELQRFWAPYINSEGPPRPAVQIALELLWLHARHVRNTEEFGTPYVCDNGYNKILHRVLKDCLKTDLSIRTIASRHMEKDD
jgi:hypothetical protein